MAKEQSYTPSEIAALLGLSLKTVNKLIDDNSLTGRPAARSRRSRVLGFQELTFIAAVKELRQTGDVHVDFQQKILELLRQAALGPLRSRTRELPLTHFLVLQIAPLLRSVREKENQLRKAREMVVEDPEILGGEPVIKGTRIPVYLVADMLAKGASQQEILEGYPTLAEEQVELASLYAIAYPRRGRPPRHPWH